MGIDVGFQFIGGQYVFGYISYVIGVGIVVVIVVV